MVHEASTYESFLEDQGEEHLDQLRPRYGSDQDDDPCEIPTSVLSTETLPAGTDHAPSSSSMNQRNNPRLPTGDEYGRHNLRRSARKKRHPKKILLICIYIFCRSLFIWGGVVILCNR